MNLWSKFSLYDVIFYQILILFKFFKISFVPLSKENLKYLKNLLSHKKWNLAVAHCMTLNINLGFLWGYGGCDTLFCWAKGNSKWQERQNHSQIETYLTVTCWITSKVSLVFFYDSFWK